MFVFKRSLSSLLCAAKPRSVSVLWPQGWGYAKLLCLKADGFSQRLKRVCQPRLVPDNTKGKLSLLVFINLKLLNKLSL